MEVVLLLYLLLFNCTFYQNDGNTGSAVYVNETGEDGTPGVFGTTITNIFNSIFWGSIGSTSPHFHFSSTSGGAPEINISHSLADATDCASMEGGGTGLTCGGEYDL